MTRQINKRWQSLLLLMTIILLGVSISASARKNWNKKTPKPDFSAMEEYYDIVEYEYDFTGDERNLSENRC